MIFSWKINISDMTECKPGMMGKAEEKLFRKTCQKAPRPKATQGKPFGIQFECFLVAKLSHSIGECGKLLQLHKPLKTAGGKHARHTCARGMPAHTCTKDL